MNTSKIHADGEIDFLNSLKETYLKLKDQLIKNKNISEKERSEQLKEIKDKFESDKKEVPKKLF